MNPDLVDLQIRGSESFASLGPAERVKFDLWMRIILQQSQTMYLRHLLFSHDPDDHLGARRLLEQSLRKQGFREWLDQAEPD